MLLNPRDLLTSRLGRAGPVLDCCHALLAATWPASWLGGSLPVTVAKLGLGQPLDTLLQVGTVVTVVTVVTVTVQEARLGPALATLLHCGLAGPGPGLASCWDEDLVLSLLDTATYHWLIGVADL